MNDPAPVTLMQHLDRLEKQTRWCKTIGAAALAALALVLSAGAAGEKVADSVMMKRLIIVDKDQQARVVLQVLDLRPEGAPVLSFLTKDRANSLALVDRDGKILWKVP